VFGWILIALVVGLIAFCLVRAQKGKKAGTAESAPKSRYAGLVFEAEEHCCAAAAKMDRRRFLIAEAPKVPLATCSDPALCHCKYRSVDDRRDGDDRREVVGALSREMPIGDERSNRRAGKERRKETISYDYD